MPVKASPYTDLGVTLLERRLLRLLRLERLARAHQASTTREDLFALSAEVEEAMAAWRLAVGR